MSAEQQVRGFLAKFDPSVARVAKAARTKLRRLLPGAIELVYDNYNALAIGFSPTERASDVIVSIALYPRWVSLFFMRGVELKDPRGLLKGSGNQVRHIVLTEASILDSPGVRTLLKAAVSHQPKALGPLKDRRTIVKSVSAKQRPRKPAASRGGR